MAVLALVGPLLLGLCALPAAAGSPLSATIALVEDREPGGSYVAAGSLRSELAVHNLTPQTLVRPVTAAALSGVRFVALTGITVSYGSPYSTAEIDALVAWVKAGGALFLDGDWYAKEQFGPIAGPNFGIFYNDSTLTDATDNDGGQPDSPIIHQFAAHPVAQGLHKVVVFRGVSIERLREGAFAVARADNDSKPANAPVLATVVKGAGRLAAISDGNAVNDWGVSQPYDNKQMLTNIVSWLLGDLEAGQPEQGDLAPEPAPQPPGLALLEELGVASGWVSSEVKAHGISVQPLGRPIDQQNLTGVRLIALTGNRWENGVEVGYSAGEAAAVGRFVKAGGALLVVADFTQYARVEEVTGQNFGIRFDSRIVQDPTDNVDGEPDVPIIHTFADHPVSHGLSHVFVNRGVSMVLDTGALAVAQTDRDSFPANAPVLATVVKGLGRVAAITDGNAFDAGYFQGYDNPQALKNIISWLLGELPAGQDAQGVLPGEAGGVALLEDEALGVAIANSALRNALESHGLAVRTLTRPINAQLLAGARFVELTGLTAATGSGRAYTASEIDALLKWVEAGGALLVAGEMGVSASLGPITDPYLGVSFNEQVVTDVAHHQGTAVDEPFINVFAQHPMMENMSTFVLDESLSLAVNGSAVAVAFSGSGAVPPRAPVLAVEAKGAGRIVVASDASSIHDWGAFSPYGNRQLLESVLAWVLGETELGPTAGPLPTREVAVPASRPAVTAKEPDSAPAAILVIMIAATAALTPSARFAAVTLIAVPLFTRLRKDDVRNQVNRGRLLQFIADRPGASFSQLKRGLSLSNGACAYHLMVLERGGEIRRVVEGGAVRFYPLAYKFEVDALPPLSYFQRQILEVLVRMDSGTAGSIGGTLRARGFGVTDKNLGYHLRVLTREKELVATRREGSKTIYYLEPWERGHIARRLKAEASVDDLLDRVAGAPPDAGEMAGAPAARLADFLAEYLQGRRQEPSGRESGEVTVATSAEGRGEGREPAVSSHFIPDGQALAPKRYPGGRAE